MRKGTVISTSGSTAHTGQLSFCVGQKDIAHHIAQKR